VVHPSTYGKLHGTIANSLTPERASHSTSNRSVLLRNRCLQIPKIHEASPASSRPTETSCAVTYAVLDMHLWSSSFPFYSDCSMCLQKDAPFSRTACFLLFLIVRSSAWPPPPSSAAVSLREHGLYLEAYSTLNRKIKSEPGPPARALHLDPVAVAASDRPSTGCLDAFHPKSPIAFGPYPRSGPNVHAKC
jgi:hypothetical protein